MEKPIFTGQVHLGQRAFLGGGQVALSGSSHSSSYSTAARGRTIFYELEEIKEQHTICNLENNMYRSIQSSL